MIQTNIAMKRIVTPLTIFFCFALTSCFDNEFMAEESIFKAEILDYLVNIQQDKSEENSLKIETIINSIDFTKVDLKSLRFGHELLIADLQPRNNNDKGKISKLLLLKVNQKISRGQVIVFDKSSLNNDANKLIVSLMSNAPQQFSGRYEVRNLYDNLLFFNVLDKGNLKENGQVRKKGKSNSSGKTNGCIDWYLITRYYGNGALIWQSEQYIGTTCDCDQNTTRTSGVQCGGGGDGGGTGGLPLNPVQGQQYTINNPVGVYKVLEYHCYDYACLWEVIYTQLEEVVVQADRDTYYFLPIDPLPNQSILGPDGLIYTYDANWAQWNADLQSQNNLCGGYVFTSTGEGLTAEILGLGATAHNASTNQLLNPYWGEMCVTYGSSTIVTNSTVGSQIFNQSWNTTMNEAQAWLNTQSNPTTVSLSTYILQRLRFNLDLYAEGYVSLSTGPCAGNIASTAARYCN